MPNKTIYVADADLPVFEKAQELAGENLSATIVQALRRFVREHEPDERGFRDVEVKVGKIAYVHKRFRGRLLTRGRLRERRGPLKEYEVYLTARERLAVYLHLESLDAFGEEEHEYRLEVYDDLESLKANIPDELYQATAQMLSGNPVEDLDI